MVMILFHFNKKINDLYFLGNPVADAEDYRVEVLIVIRRLERLDKDEFNEEERGEAEEV